jgi:hypothetical protein
LTGAIHIAASLPQMRSNSTTAVLALDSLVAAMQSDEARELFIPVYLNKKWAGSSYKCI